MQKLFEHIKQGLYFNKFELDNNIAVEYSCPLEEERMGICSQSDYIVHILSGKKTWKTLDGTWTLNAGQTLYVKKGAAIIHQNFDEEFCMLGFFLTDELIREVVAEIKEQTALPSTPNVQAFSALNLPPTPYLEGYFSSMLVYFQNKGQPQDYLLKLKLKELLLTIFSNPTNRQLISYFRKLASTQKTVLPQIMETNFCYNLKLEDFAKLCHRSLSTFKRDFKEHYQTTPGKWLLSRRLEHASLLLQDTAAGITHVAFDCGFEDVSHFSRVFKKCYGVSPTQFQEIQAP